MSPQKKILDKLVSKKRTVTLSVEGGRKAFKVNF